MGVLYKGKKEKKSRLVEIISFNEVLMEYFSKIKKKQKDMDSIPTKSKFSSIKPYKNKSFALQKKGNMYTAYRKKLTYTFVKSIFSLQRHTTYTFYFF